MEKLKRTFTSPSKTIKGSRVRSPPPPFSVFLVVGTRPRFMIHATSSLTHVRRALSYTYILSVGRRIGLAAVVGVAAAAVAAARRGLQRKGRRRRLALAGSAASGRRRCVSKCCIDRHHMCCMSSCELEPGSMSRALTAFSARTPRLHGMVSTRV